MGEVLVRLTVEEAKALGDPFADPFRLRKQFETGRCKLRAALDSPPVEERAEHRLAARDDDDEIFLVGATHSALTTEELDRVRALCRACLGYRTVLQSRTITTLSDGSSLTSPWTDLPGEEGER